MCVCVCECGVCVCVCVCVVCESVCVSVWYVCVSVGGCVCLRQSLIMLSWLAQNSLCRSGSPQTHRDLVSGSERWDYRCVTHLAQLHPVFSVVPGIEAGF